MGADGTYRLVGGGEEVLWAHPSSVMFNRTAEWCVFGECVEMRGKTYIRDVSWVLFGLWALLLTGVDHGYREGVVARNCAGLLSGKKLMVQEAPGVWLVGRLCRRKNTTISEHLMN